MRMNEIEIFLQKENAAMDARRYREILYEYSIVSKLIEEMENKEAVKKYLFKKKLKELGVNIIEREAENSHELFRKE